MKYLLDTNTVSYYLRGVPATVKHIQRQKPSALAISSITAMELAYGVEKRQSLALAAAAVQGFCSGIQILPFDAQAARRAGLIRATLERTGITISLADSQIAGHALAAHLVIISSDAIFRRVPGLTVTNWA
jgi:tRNA(fMet)-specific endonuclease VapC